MRQFVTHSWSVSPREAIRIQNELIRPAVRICGLRRRVRFVGGSDLSFDKRDARAFGAFIVWDVQAGQVVERASAVVPLTFPYVPGLLTFREAPALLAAWANLKSKPDVLMFDGTGYAHPRRCGLASHMGVVLGVPAIGVAKSRLCGEAGEPGPRRGDAADWFDRGEQVGVVLRTRDGVKPLFISPGHLVSLADSVRLVLACCTKYRLPEPTRLAHQFVTAMKKA
ncbi:MAG: deoxyribonuclease V [Phycisphaerae bacterium]|nr:deoxyribonuclease V [Phycisphaerae bacterium]